MTALLSYYGNLTEKRYQVVDKFLCSPAQPQSRLDATSSPLLCGLCMPSALYTILFLRQLDRPRPLPLGQRHFLKPAVRPLKLTNLIDLHNKGVCLVRRATEPVLAGDNGFLLGPSILDHASISYSHLSQV